MTGNSMYRTRWQPDQHFTFQPNTLRWLTLAALGGYPAAALLALVSADGTAANLIGQLVAPLTVFLGLLALTSQAYRIVHARPSQLDEFELQLRHRAMSKAYSVLTALILMVAFYLSEASDRGWWLPSTRDHWRGLLWGAILFSFLLPTATLVWSRDYGGTDLDEDNEVAA